MIEAIVNTYHDARTRDLALYDASKLVGQPISSCTEIASLVIRVVREDEQRCRVYVVAQQREEK